AGKGAGDCPAAIDDRQHIPSQGDVAHGAVEDGIAQDHVAADHEVVVGAKGAGAVEFHFQRGGGDQGQIAGDGHAAGALAGGKGQGLAGGGDVTGVAAGLDANGLSSRRRQVNRPLNVGGGG